MLIYRLPEDLNLANNVPEIDIILGGHDHFPHHELVGNGVTVVKSGYDFRWLTKLEVFSQGEGKRVTVNFEKIDITSNIPEYSFIIYLFFFFNSFFDIDFIGDDYFLFLSFFLFLFAQSFSLCFYLLFYFLNNNEGMKK